MNPYLPVPIGLRRFDETTNVSPLAWNRSRSHNCVVPGNIGTAQSAEASSLVLMFFLARRVEMVMHATRVTQEMKDTLVTSKMEESSLGHLMRSTRCFR